MRNRIRTTVGLLLILLLSSCKGSDPYPDLDDYFKKINDQQARYTAQLHANDIKIPMPVFYNGNLRRSPFLDTSQVTGAMTNPLQAYSLTMLRLLGTVTENKDILAYLAAPDNMVYAVRVGDIIGDHHGKIISIEPGSVKVMELDTDNPDEQMQRVVALTSGSR